MNMRMMIELLVSRMQDEMCSRLELTCGSQRFVEGSPSRAEQQIVKRFSIAEDQAG